MAGDGYWGLRYYNRPDRFPDCPIGIEAYARYEQRSGQALIVVANFLPGQAAKGRLRLPRELVADIALAAAIEVELLLHRTGATSAAIATLSAAGLTEQGFPIEVADQTCHVYRIRRL